jgi:GT2 family glycosyltransferase
MDEALGPGMPSGVGEDSYLLYRIARAGFTVVYQPAAYVYHRHRDQEEALLRQISSYYSGHVAHNLTTLLRDRDLRSVARLARFSGFVTATRLRSIVRHEPLAAASARAMTRGATAGPANYVRSRRRVRRLSRA